MNLLIVTRFFPPAAGGAEQQLKRIAESLAKEGHNVTVLTSARNFKTSPPPKDSGFMLSALLDPEIRGIGTLFFLLCLFFRIVRLRRNFDGILVSMFNETSVCAVLAGKCLKKRIVLRPSSPGNYSWIQKKWWSRFGLKVLFSADAVSAQTEKLRDFMSEKGFPRNRITVIPNLIDPKSFSGETKRKDRGIRNILWCGRLHPDKNPLLLIPIAERLKQACLPFRIHIVGDGPLKQNFLNAMEQKNLSEYFVLHGFQKNVVPFFLQADVYLLTSDRDAMPNTVLEAMAANVPIVATDTGGLPVLTKNGFSSLLSPPGDAEALATAICRLLASESLRRTLTDNAFRTCKTKFSPHIVSKQYLRLFTEKQ